MLSKPQEQLEPVVACNLGAIDPEHLDAHVAVAEDIFSSSSILEIKELAQGYAFRLPLEKLMLYKTIAFIANERLCCPFFTFTLVVGGELWLELSGIEEVKDYIKLNIVHGYCLMASWTLVRSDACR